MVVAMLLISFVDALAKYLSASYSPLFLGWARYAVASCVVLPLTAASHGRRLFPAQRRASHVLRTVFLVGAMTLYFLAVARLPLATASSASLVGPIFAVILSVLVLGERMTVGKALGLTLGLAGALVIVQPGGSMNPAVLAHDRWRRLHRHRGTRAAARPSTMDGFGGCRAGGRRDVLTCYERSTMLRA
jgi:drug/metabolite transporter (DMT)-like permease